MLNVPVLLITFNRPDHVCRVLTEIRKQGPRQLFVCQDGPRDLQDDYKKVLAVRRVVEDLVDWPCEMHTLYHEKNLGCGTGPMTGIDWFFKHVDMGIVMEDDCLPHPDFFGYCEELLKKYKCDNRISFINATLYDDRWTCKASYGFSRYMVTGAWAGWKRTWEGFDLSLHLVDAKKLRAQILMLTGNRGEADWWYFLCKEIQQDKYKSYWDYQMQIKLFMQEAYTIHPQRNLISNIGFDAEGTHTMCNDGRGGRCFYPILPLAHPDKVEIDKVYDEYCWAKAHSKGWLRDSINYIYQSLLWSDGIGHKLLMKYKTVKGSRITRRL